MRIDETENKECFKVSGRGLLHLSVLIETMRREGYELSVGKPEVIRKKVDGVWHEPFEVLEVDVPTTSSAPSSSRFRCVAASSRKWLPGMARTRISSSAFPPAD